MDLSDRGRKRRTLGLLVGLISLAACQSGGLLPGGRRLNTPAGVDASKDAVDGLLVGHRLMAANEPELALRAYLRAASEQGVNVDVLSALGSANLKLGRLGQAEQLLRRALELDERFVPALNNLGVVLIEKGSFGEAKLVFEAAYSLDSGQSDQIRENLRLAIAKIEKSAYDAENENYNFTLVRRGKGQFLLLSTL